MQGQTCCQLLPSSLIVLVQAYNLGIEYHYSRQMKSKDEDQKSVEEELVEEERKILWTALFLILALFSTSCSLMFYAVSASKPRRPLSAGT
mmetsp:Transcript_76/g.129  ORF Transcript_76/g.129 Transcript_76/m.129 type:complete len:91 (+) Transcript_76:27-299(+)